MKCRIRPRGRAGLVLGAAAVGLIASSVAAVGWATTATAFHEPVTMQGTTDWIQTSWGADREIGRCPADQVMVGVKLEPSRGLEKSRNFVKCARPTLAAHDGVYIYPGGQPRSSDWIDQVPNEPTTFSCAADPMIASLHLGNYLTHGESQYRCAPLVVESASVGEQLAATVSAQRWSDWITAFRWEDDHTEQLDFEYTCPAGSAITAREHQKSPHGVVRFQCTSWEARS